VLERIAIRHYTLINELNIEFDSALFHFLIQHLIFIVFLLFLRILLDLQFHLLFLAKPKQN
jgi:hypothetical protein